MKGYLLDTNIAIAILSNESRVIEFIQQASRDRMKMYFSVITECEVLSGLKDDEHLRAANLFGNGRVIEVSSEIAKTAGSLRRTQREKGRKLKTPDALIIASAVNENLCLVSRDHDMKFVNEELNINVIDI